MSPLGETLQKTRQARGVTLDEVARETRISRRYLEALENENFGLLPAPVYARGFLRTYSRYLGLEPAELMPLFPVGYVDEPTLEPWPKVKTPATWPSSGLLAGVVVGALILIVLLLYSIGGQGESDSQSFFGAQTGTPGSETEVAGAAQTPEGAAVAPIAPEEEISTAEATPSEEEAPAVVEEEAPAVVEGGTPAPAEEETPAPPVSFPPGTIPDLQGLSMDQAVGTLQSMDVPYLVVRVRSGTVPVDYVIRQSPSPGSDIESGQVVTLEVSRGP
jgi:cytoskeletal protein RodZ